MAGAYFNWPYNVSSSSVTNAVYTIGTTWDSTTAAPRAVEWNGAAIRLGPSAVVAAPSEESPTEWLRRRVEEMRVDVLAEAA
jgi:hypothetical protein